MALDTYQLKSMLKDRAERLSDIAEKLDPTGDAELSTTERYEVKVALMGWARECFNESLFFMVEGNIKQAHEGLGHVLDTFEELS